MNFLFYSGGVVVLRWSVGLAIKSSRVRVSAGHYGVKTVVTHTYVPLSPSSIIWKLESKQARCAIQWAHVSCNGYFIFSNQSTGLSSRTVDSHQMYVGCSVVGKASTVDIEISPIPPLIFTGAGSKSAKFGVVFNITQH